MMKKYVVIKTHFDKIDLSEIKDVDVLICLDPQEVDYKTEKEHFHDNYNGFRYGICALKITDTFPEIMYIKASNFEDAILQIEALGYYKSIAL